MSYEVPGCDQVDGSPPAPVGFTELRASWKNALAGVSCEVSSAPRIVPGGLAEVAVRRFGALCAPRPASLFGFGTLTSVSV
eukprot:5262143-Pyramimonas_sp.AAC.1